MWYMRFPSLCRASPCIRISDTHPLGSLMCHQARYLLFGLMKSGLSDHFHLYLPRPLCHSIWLQVVTSESRESLHLCHRLRWNACIYSSPSVIFLCWEAELWGKNLALVWSGIYCATFSKNILYQLGGRHCGHGRPYCSCWWRVLVRQVKLTAGCDNNISLQFAFLTSSFHVRGVGAWALEHVVAHLQHPQLDETYCLNLYRSVEVLIYSMEADSYFAI